MDELYDMVFAMVLTISGNLEIICPFMLKMFYWLFNILSLNFVDCILHFFASEYFCLF